MRKKFPTPRAGAQTPQYAQVSSHVPVRHLHSGSLTAATSSREPPLRSVRQACQVVAVARSSPSLCNRRAWLENQNKCVPSSDNRTVGAASVIAWLDPVAATSLFTCWSSVVASCPFQNHTLCSDLTSSSASGRFTVGTNKIWPR